MCQKKEQSNFKDGKPADGEWFAWHENGELKVEIIIENGETVSEKFWNERSEEWENAGEERGGEIGADPLLIESA